MKIVVIDEKRVKAHPTKGEKCILAKRSLTSDDVIIVKGNSLKFYEKLPDKSESYKKYAMMMAAFNGVCMHEIRILIELFETYNEVGRIREALKEYPQYANEDIEGYVEDIMNAVRVSKGTKEQKYDALEEEVLKLLLCEKCTKEELVNYGMISFKEIKLLYDRFLTDYRRKQHFLSPACGIIVEQFNKGDIKFKNSLADYARKKQVDEKLIADIIHNVINKQNTLSAQEEKFFLETVRDSQYMFKLSNAEKEEFENLIDRIIEDYCTLAKEIYCQHVENLKRHDKMNCDEMQEYCIEYGLNMKVLMHYAKK